MNQDDKDVFNRGVDTRNWMVDYLYRVFGIKLEKEKRR